jgi:hypothetical protein
MKTTRVLERYYMPPCRLLRTEHILPAVWRNGVMH